MTWQIINKELTNSEFVEMPVFSEPFPKASWQIINRELKTGLIPDIELIGAFANDKNLVKVVISKSVKAIGENAFRNTNLSSVKIASNCTYNLESFPDKCKVDFYE